MVDMKQDYLTKQNLIQKNDQWLEMIHFSKKRKTKFSLQEKKSALLVIDMQEYFTNKSSHAFIPSSTIIINQINQLIRWYKANKNLIIFTYHAYDKNESVGLMKKWWNEVLYTDDPLAQISSKILFNKKEDLSIKKNRYSAFYNSNLEQILAQNHIKQLVITGVMTHLCCETTAREAFMKDYEVFFVIDATATSSETLHISSIRTLSDGFAIPMKTNDICSNGEQSC